MNILVTGGSGFLGENLIKRIYKEYPDCKIRVLARNEGNLVKLREVFPNIEIIVGSVSDEYACNRAMSGVDLVFHLAAMKHVGLAEENVRECIESNIPTTLLDATLKHKPRMIIGISTDKAASRRGVYGSTKFLMEKLFSEYEKLNTETRYRIVRYGNVIYSTGSVLCKWKDKMLRGERVTVTDPDATRFFWTVDQAVDLIFECMEKANDSTPYATGMKSIRIGDLLEAMMSKYGVVGVNNIGLQNGENMHEIITEDGPTSEHAPMFTRDEILEMI